MINDACNDGKRFTRLHPDSLTHRRSVSHETVVDACANALRDARPLSMGCDKRPQVHLAIANKHVILNTHRSIPAMSTPQLSHAFLLPKERLFTIPGPAGMLECSVLLSEHTPHAIIIVCHPHPLHQGTMFNKVVTTCMQAAHLAQCQAIRFNFRSVGASQGVHDHGRGETDDLYAVYNHARKKHPHMPIHVLGFSFGAMVAHQFYTRGMTTHASRAIFIAPPCKKLNGHATLFCTPYWFFAEDDELFALDDQMQWLQTFQPHAKARVVPQASHFFHGKLLELKKNIQTVLSGQINPMT